MGGICGRGMAETLLLRQLKKSSNSYGFLFFAKQQFLMSPELHMQWLSNTEICLVKWLLPNLHVKKFSSSFSQCRYSIHFPIIWSLMSRNMNGFIYFWDLYFSSKLGWNLYKFLFLYTIGLQKEKKGWAYLSTSPPRWISFRPLTKKDQQSNCTGGTPKALQPLVIHTFRCCFT